MPGDALRESRIARHLSFCPTGFAPPPPACPRGRRLAPAGQPRTCVQTATAIGRQLVQEAVWDQERCNWVGFLPDADGPMYAPPHTTYRALGPDLYAGTSGVALFL